MADATNAAEKGLGMSNKWVWLGIGVALGALVLPKVRAATGS